MLRTLMHRMAARPWCYERLQALSGARKLRKRVAELLGGDGAPLRVLDLGGGTGAIRPFLRGGWHYICLDLEGPKLQGFRGGYGRGEAVLGDCTEAPVASGSIDVALSMLMSHHLTKRGLVRMLVEVRRVLKPGGRFIFLDGIDVPERRVGRFLWSLDRGAHPRRAETLLAAIAAAMPVVYHDRFAVWHEYLLVEAVNGARERRPEDTASEGAGGSAEAVLETAPSRGEEGPAA
ncbi:MAG TPA: class I SAM-dependent methyltransferase [Bryobacterales bacterium]|nr:class I SAM-dependent methyltransferase [Bryobacterales bacterium]